MVAQRMQHYYILLFDAHREALEVVDDCEMGDFDVRAFWTGREFTGSIPDQVRIEISEGMTSDLLGNPISWLIMSRRLREIVESVTFENVQFIPITVWRKHKAVKFYSVVNPIGSVDGIVQNKKRLPNIQNLKLTRRKYRLTDIYFD